MGVKNEISSLTFKSYEQVTVYSPLELGQAGIIVDPETLRALWGDGAPKIYLEELGKHMVDHPYEYVAPIQEV